MDNYMPVIINLIKMTFIINMINDGWKFRCLRTGILEFKKNKSSAGQINLRRLIRKNLIIANGFI